MAMRHRRRVQAPGLVGAPTPTSSKAWDARIQAILDAAFHSDDEVLEWVMEFAVKAEAQAARAELLRERSAARVTDDVMAPVALMGTRLVRELRHLIACYHALEQVTGVA